MSTRISVLACTILAFCAVRPFAQTGEGYAQTSLANVHVRAGTADQNAELKVLPRGYPLHVTGRSGDWAEVEMPGGIVGYVHKGRPGRPYVDLKDGGQGLVVVADLMLRPHPNTDWPAMGKLAANQDLLVLGSEGEDWYRVIAPPAQRAWVWASYVERFTDQDAGKAAFEQKAAEEREKLMAGGEISKAGRERLRVREERVARLADLDRRLETALAGNGGVPAADELASIRREYLAVADGAGDDTALAEEARRKAVYVQGKEEVVAKLAEAERRVAAISAEREAANSAYRDRLEQYRTQKSRDLREAAEGARDGRFLRYGVGTVRKDVLGSISGVPTYILSKASEDRFLLTSLRYDLSEYVGREIAISGWKMLTPESSDSLRRVQITRLELVD